MPGSDLGPGEVRFLASDEPFVGRRLVIVSLLYAKSRRILIESLAEDLGADETKKQISGNSFSQAPHQRAWRTMSGIKA